MIFGTLHCTATGVLLKTSVYLTINDCIFFWGSFEKCSHYLFHCKKRLIFITSILWIKLNLSSFTFHLKVSQKNVNCHPALLQSLHKTFKVKVRPMYKQNGSIKLVSWIALSNCVDINWFHGTACTNSNCYHVPCGLHWRKKSPKK